MTQKLRILILGGGGLTGPHQVRYALARGHHVTVFNRGRTNAQWPAEVQQLVGDRTTGDLEALKQGEWDVCIDNPTTYPAWVRDAGQVLQGRAGRYIFISTISVYADLSQPPSEDSPLAAYEGPDRYAENIDSLRASGMQLYGPLKAASEQEAVRWFGERATIIRPGLIVGPGDETDRFTYWPLRVARGGEVLAPGTPDDPTQVIDARDLAEWTIRMAEQGTGGVFNATGPAQPLRFGEMLDGVKTTLRADARFTWVPAPFLEKQGVKPWLDLPAWVPPGGEAAGMMEANITRALAAGLTFRPLADTVQAAMAWFASRNRQPKAGLGAEREAQVLAAWKAAR